MRRTILSVLCAAVVMTTAFAQTPGRPGQNAPQNRGAFQFDSEAASKRVADELRSQLDLTDKQYKQVQKFYQKEYKEIAEALESAIAERIQERARQRPDRPGQSPEGMGQGQRPDSLQRGQRPQGMPRGMGQGQRPEGMRQGQRPDSLQRGQRPQGMPRGMGQGQRPEGMRQGQRPQGMGQGQRPEDGPSARPAPLPGFDDVKAGENVEKNMKKILNDEQYLKFIRLKEANPQDQIGEFFPGIEPFAPNWHLRH